MRISDWSQTCALPIYPFACPIHADLTGLPPVLLVVPECDLLAEQSLVMEARLEAAGVATTTTIYPGDRKSVVSGKSVSVRVDLGGRRIIKKKKHYTLLIGTL